MQDHQPTMQLQCADQSSRLFKNCPVKNASLFVHSSAFVLFFVCLKSLCHSQASHQPQESDLTSVILNYPPSVLFPKWNAINSISPYSSLIMFIISSNLFQHHLNKHQGHTQKKKGKTFNKKLKNDNKSSNFFLTAGCR